MIIWAAWNGELWYQWVIDRLHGSMRLPLTAAEFWCWTETFKSPAMVPWCPGLCHSYSHCSKASWACNTIRMGKMCMYSSLPPRAQGTTWPTARHGVEAAACSQSECCTSEDLLRYCQWQADISRPLTFHLTVVLSNSWEKQSDTQVTRWGGGLSLWSVYEWAKKKTKKRHSLLKILEYSSNLYSKFYKSDLNLLQPAFPLAEQCYLSMGRHSQSGSAPKWRQGWGIQLPGHRFWFGFHI